MPITIAEPSISLSDFSEGVCPDYEPASVPVNGLLRAKNLIPDVGTGQPQTREGFKRLPGFSVNGYTVKSLHSFNKLSNNKHYLIAVLTSGTDVKVYAYDLDLDTSVQISPAVKVWNSKNGIHYGFTVDDKFYGGSEKDPMYSWDGTTWNDNASQITYGAFIEGKAYSLGDGVSLGGKNYSSKVNWRKELEWADQDSFNKGDLVSRRDPALGYWRTFRCRKDHDTSPENRPGDGTGTWRAVWKTMRMLPPLDEDGKPTKHWAEIPDAPVTNVAAFNTGSGRMMARHDNADTQHIIYSETVKTSEDERLEIPDAKWNPTRWRITLPETGAGFQSFKTHKGDRITAVLPYGLHFLVFSRHHTHTIAGWNPRTWNPRFLAPVGAVGPRAITEHDGLAYFISDQGLHVTDGTTVEEAPGADKIRDFLRDSIGWEGFSNVTLFSHKGFVWISLPTKGAKAPDYTLLYDPNLKSFWPLNLHIQAATIAHLDGTDQLFFSTPSKTGTFASATYAWDGVEHDSTSTMTWTSSPAHQAVNLFRNPGFEGTMTMWDSTNSQVKKTRSKSASYYGKVGCELNNGHNSAFHGITQVLNTTPTFTYHLQAYVRRPNWQKMRNFKPNVKFKQSGGEIEPTITKVGHGWWKAETTILALSNQTTVGILVSPNHTVELDAMICYHDPGSFPNRPPPFDGGGGEDTQPPPEDPTGDPGDGDPAETGTFEGGNGLIMQYAHPESDYTDDTAQIDYVSRAIPWYLQTTWLSFGTAREIRRLRRIWALVRGSLEVTLRVFTNYRTTSDVETTSVAPVTTDEPALHFESNLPEDAAAVSFEVEGEGPSGVLGVAADTEFRRVSFGRK